MEEVTDGTGSGGFLILDESDLQLLEEEFERELLKEHQAYLYPGFPNYSEHTSIDMYVCPVDGKANPIDEADLEILKTRGDFSIDGCKPKIEISSTSPEGYNRKILRLTYYLNNQRETIPFNKQLVANTENIATILGRQMNCSIHCKDHYHHVFGDSGYFLTKFNPKESK
jgi:hypothetical protein